MSVCWCTLGGTRACEACPNSPSRFEGIFISHPIQPDYQWTWKTDRPKIIREKFDDKGNLIERITEE